MGKGYRSNTGGGTEFVIAHHATKSRHISFGLGVRRPVEQRVGRHLFHDLPVVHEQALHDRNECERAIGKTIVLMLG